MASRRPAIDVGAGGEFSLLRAKAKLFEATKEERRIQQAHKRLLINHINECIERGMRTVDYVVPCFLIGSYDEYDVHEISLWLVRQARRGHFDAELLPTNPPTIRLSGWYDADWLDENAPETIATKPRRAAPTTSKKATATTTKTRDVGGSAMTIVAAKKSSLKSSLPARHSLSGEEASRLAQSGQLSRRLQQAASRYSSNSR